MNRRDFFRSGLFAGAGAASAQGSGFQAGFAERDITPEIGMEQPGGYGKSFHKSLHDPCKVRAAVFQESSRRVALVGVDALVVPAKLVREVRQEVKEVCGIPPEAVLIGASHSHSSGPTGMVLPGEYDHASPLVRKLAYEKSSNADARYLELVRRQTVEAIRAADQARSEVRASVGVGKEEKAAFNRRFRMKNGLSYTHPGQGNPDIVKAAGPIDPEVGVIGCFSGDGKLAGCVVNYACHATTSPGGISANWVYYLENTIRGCFGPNVIVVFLQGACGDVTQVDNLNPYAQPSGAEYAKLVGGRVGAEAVKVLLSAYAGTLAPLEAKNTVVRMKRRAPSPQRLKRALELVQQDPKTAGVTEWTFAKEILMLDALIQKEPAVDVEFQAVQVGPAVFLANPAELFCQLGLDMKKGSPFRFTFPVELANGVVGYVPTVEAFGKNGGGYETRLTAYSNLEITAGRRFVEECVGLARSLKPGAVPTPPKAKPFSQPWSYGSVPPEVD